MPEAATESGKEAQGSNPIELLAPGSRHVILGDPGSGKSTLLRFLALAGTHPEIRARYATQEDSRLTVLVILRRYADELKATPRLSLVDYLLRVIPQDFNLPAIDREFLEFYLYAGKAILLFDGVDELPRLFVKERAGLLIEVGSDLYSFVHLTFQEYLSASHLRKSGETAGVSVIWDIISERCAQPRWHEVIRLLVGSFERSESQQYILERILRDPDDRHALNCSLLAGGGLVDSAIRRRIACTLPASFSSTFGCVSVIEGRPDAG